MRSWPLVLCLIALITAPLGAAVIGRLSVATDGTEANDFSWTPAISADGRWAVFASLADNLVPDDTNGCMDLFSLDRATGEVTRLSVGVSGEEADGDSYSPAMTPDGRFVAFISFATNLVEGDTNDTGDIFLYDRQAGTIELISVPLAGAEGESGESRDPSISADGRFVAFSSAASNLVAGDDNGCQDVFLRDRQTETTERVSVGPLGMSADNESYAGDVSDDGRYVVFDSYASNLLPEPWSLEGECTIYLYDRLAQTTTLVAVGLSGEPADASSYCPVLTPDGRYVAFISSASNLVEGDDNYSDDVFLRDMTTGVTELVSRPAGGGTGNNYSWYPVVSEDGRFVSFLSDADNLVEGDTNGCTDVFVKDRETGIVTRVNVAADGSEDNEGSGSVITAPRPKRAGALYERPAMSADGRLVAFTSHGSNLVPDDTNECPDVFLSIVGLLPPVEPSDLTATGLSRGRIGLEWTDNSVDEQGFLIQRKTGADGEWSQIAVVGWNVTSYEDVGLLAPTDLTAMPASTTAIDLTWGDAAEGETGYVVERRWEEEPDWVVVATLPADSTAWQDTGLITEMPYTYRVKAVCADGASPYSDEATAAPSEWQSQAVNWTVNYGDNWNVSGTVTKPGATSIRVHFAVLNIESGWDYLSTDAGDTWSGWGLYDVLSSERAGDTITLSLSTDGSITGSFTIDRVDWKGAATGPAVYAGDLFQSVSIGAPAAKVRKVLAASTTYYYRVQAVSANAQSGWSNEASAATWGEPPAPSDLGAESYWYNQVGLRWTDNATTETGFKVERKASGGNWRLVATLEADAAGYLDTTCQPGISYTYRVAAVNSFGASAWSNEATVSTPAAVATFEDVPVTSPYWLYVEAVVREGVTAGCSQTPRLFCPNSGLTRGQAAVWVCRAAGMAPVQLETATFADVPLTDQRAGYVEAIYRAGITVGCVTGTPRRFCPDSVLTRGQLAVWLCRAAGIELGSYPTPSFTDVPATSPYYRYVEALRAAGVTVGCTPTTFCPNAAISRGQAAVWVCRAFRFLEGRPR